MFGVVLRPINWLLWTFLPNELGLQWKSGVMVSFLGEVMKKKNHQLVQSTCCRACD